jgi:hypothetical protein
MRVQLSEWPIVGGIMTTKTGKARTGKTQGVPARVFRVRFEYDPDPCASLHDPEGAPLPGSRTTYEENPITPNGGAALTYEQYCEYYGDPERHVVLVAILEEKCPHCGQWQDAPGMTSLWGIDFMDDDKEAGYAGQTVEAADFGSLPGYLAEVVKGLLAEVEGHK